MRKPRHHARSTGGTTHASVRIASAGTPNADVLTGSAGPVSAAQHTAAMIAAITGLPTAEPAQVAGRS